MMERPRVASYGFDVLNPILKAFWLLVEWKFFIMHSICICHSVVTMILPLLESYLEIIFFWMALYKLVKESGLP